MSKKNIVILTGAGISKESGLDTFRDTDGLWGKIKIEDIATPEAYARNPENILKFYNKRRRSMAGDKIKPNAAHLSLVKLEKKFPGKVLLVTQNIDNLHERAGSANLLHMHGEIFKVRCDACHNVVVWKCALSLANTCNHCSTIGRMRPHVVWFGETPFHMEEIKAALELCDLFISIGTSGEVYPAAGFVQQVKIAGQGHTVELNLEPSKVATLFTETHYGPACAIVPSYVKKILNQGW